MTTEIEPTEIEPPDSELEARKARVRFDYDRHTPTYRHEAEDITHEMHSRCPIAWSTTYDGHWVVSGAEEVFGIARDADALSSDHDVENKRRGYRGVSIPGGQNYQLGFLEMDPPGQRHYRQALNPYLSPAAIERWVPFADELVQAAIDEHVETGEIDFVDDLSNVVPAIQTMAMMGLPLADWHLYAEPMHAVTYTPPTAPEMAQVTEMTNVMLGRLFQCVLENRQSPRPGLINAVINAAIEGEPASDADVVGCMSLLIGGGFDTTTALFARSMEWLSDRPDERARLAVGDEDLLNSATEEFLRFFTPAPGDGRTIAKDFEFAGVEFKEGERLWVSWSMANRDPRRFSEPDELRIDRKINRHHSFGLGNHRCIGSNLGRMLFKRMLRGVFDRMPDFRCDPERSVPYETVGIINGMRHLPANFTPGPRLGAGLEETIARLQERCDNEGLAQPVTRRATPAS